MFPPSSIRDSTHETSVLIFEIPNKNPFNFFSSWKTSIFLSTILRHAGFTDSTYRSEKGKLAANFSSPHVRSAVKGRKIMCGILAQVAIKSTKISLAQSFHGDLPLKKRGFVGKKWSIPFHT